MKELERQHGALKALRGQGQEVGIRDLSVAYHSVEGDSVRVGRGDIIGPEGMPR